LSPVDALELSRALELHDYHIRLLRDVDNQAVQLLDYRRAKRARDSSGSLWHPVSGGRSMGLPVVKASFNVAHGGEDRATVQQVAEQIERRGDWLAAGRTDTQRQEGRPQQRAPEGPGR
jgi:hypothetical protein